MATAFQPPVNSGSGSSYTVPAGRYAYVSMAYTITGNTGSASITVLGETITAAAGESIISGPHGAYDGSSTIRSRGNAGSMFLMVSGQSVSSSTSGDGSASVTVSYIEFNNP